MQKIRNIGIFAHVDAGKTTLTEQLLRYSGAIQAAGSVDAGTAHTDRLDIERRRGISVKSTCAQIEWQGVLINVIDTPGHADFAAEVERSMWALDGAVLLLSAVDGVQPQAENLFQALRRMKLPALVLSGAVVDVQDDDALHALIAEDDEAALEAYLEGQLYPRGRLLRALRARVTACAAYPALSGSALKGEGIDPLLDAILAYLPPPAGDQTGPVSGIVFAVEHDKALGRAAHVRLFSGALQNRDPVALAAPGSGKPSGQSKITQIRSIPLAGKGADIGRLSAGEIGALYGLPDVRVGQVIGDDALFPRAISAGVVCPRSPVQYES